MSKEKDKEKDFPNPYTKLPDGKTYSNYARIFSVDDFIAPSLEYFPKETVMEKLKPINRVFTGIKKNAPLNQLLGQPVLVSLVVENLPPKEGKSKKLCTYFADKKNYKTLIDLMLARGMSLFTSSLVLIILESASENNHVYAYQAWRILSKQPSLLFVFISIWIFFVVV